MIDGFWLVHAEGPGGGNTGGVVVFTKGKVYGGDSGFYYVGNYIEKDGIVKARLAVHNFDPSIVNILSVGKDYELEVSAKINGDAMSGTAVVPGAPSQSIGIRMEKKTAF